VHRTTGGADVKLNPRLGFVQRINGSATPQSGDRGGGGERRNMLQGITQLLLRVFFCLTGGSCVSHV